MNKAATKYVLQRQQDPQYPIYSWQNEIELAFIAGAKWQREQLEKERLKHCDELSEEDAQLESDFVVSHIKEHNRTPTFIDAIKYGEGLATKRKTNIT